MSIETAIRESKALARWLLLPRSSNRPRSELSRAPLVVAGMFRAGSGLGRAAQGCLDALLREGHAPIAVDISELFHQVDLISNMPPSIFPQSSRGTLILFVNPPEMERALLGLGLRRWHHWHIIGAWVWELSIAPKAWRRQAELVSEIWAPSQFVARTFSARYDKPVRIVPHHVPIVSREKGLKATSQKLTILSIADARSSLERKNPHAAIRMFRAAFDQDAHVELIVKCRNLSLFPKEASELRGAIAGDPRIQLHDETLDHKKQADLVESADIFLSPHRSEGFGLNLAEAMAAGKCVIATGWSGNMDFMSDETAELLPYKLVPTLDASGVYIPEPGACWAEPDFDAGVVALKSLLANPNRRASIGARAQATIANSLGARKIVEAMDIPAPSP